MNTQQEKEVGIVEDFFKILNIQVETKPSDKPDVIVKRLDNDQTIGIEVREYFVDENPNKNGSYGQNLFGFWSKVQKESETLKKNCPELQNIYVHVTLKKDELKNIATNPIVKPIASEIASFIRTNSEDVVSDKIIIPEWKKRNFRAFSNHSLMNKYISQINIRKDIGSCKWNANVNASYVGVSYDQVVKIIEEKNKKAQNFKINGLNELWLLIASPHNTVFNAMHSFPDQIDFSNSKIQESCENTIFDKIYFWSSPPHEWYKLIWPNK